jgi:hypothetical protein
MKKGEDYILLKKAGLPVPIYGVFDSSCLSDKKEGLRNCVKKILTEGSGLIGVRTEPKDTPSPLGNYPHYMPLRSFEEVIEAIKKKRTRAKSAIWPCLGFVDYCGAHETWMF